MELGGSALGPFPYWLFLFEETLQCGGYSWMKMKQRMERERRRPVTGWPVGVFCPYFLIFDIVGFCGIHEFQFSMMLFVGKKFLSDWPNRHAKKIR